MEIKDYLLIGGLALGVYFLFRKRINETLSDAFTPLKGDGNVSLLTPIPDILYNKAQDIYPSIIDKKPIIDTENISQKTTNYIKSKTSGTNKEVKSITDKSSSYKGYSGVLTVQNQSYSVSAEKAPIMAKQVYTPAKSTNLSAAQKVYTKIKVNPYS